MGGCSVLTGEIGLNLIVDSLVREILSQKDGSCVYFGV